MATMDELSDASTVIVVADDAETRAHGTKIVTAIGLHPVETDTAGAMALIAEHPRLVGLLVDASAGAIGGFEALAKIARAGREAGLNTVVAFQPDQLEEIGGLLVGEDIVLLCGPTPLDVAAALAVVKADGDLIVRDSSREAARLHQLNAEVARFAATLAKLAGQDERSDGRLSEGAPFVAEQGAGFGAQPAAELDPAEIRRTIRARRMRDDAFGLAGLFEDPAWDMLLDLFAAELERRRVSVSSLCIAAAVAPTTALRWIGKLIDAGLLDRRPDDFDRRRAFISLSARASTAMRSYVATVRRTGLAIA